MIGAGIIAVSVLIVGMILMGLALLGATPERGSGQSQETHGDE